MGRYWLIFSFGSDPPSLGSNSLQTKSLKISCWGSEDFWCLPSGWFLTRFHILYVKYGIYLFGQDFSKERNFITTREYFLKDRITVCLCPFLILHVNTLLLTQCFIYGKKKKKLAPFYLPVLSRNESLQFCGGDYSHYLQEKWKWCGEAEVLLLLECWLLGWKGDLASSAACFSLRASCSSTSPAFMHLSNYCHDPHPALLQSKRSHCLLLFGFAKSVLH